MLGVIKEYLVSLGYHVDLPSYNAVQRSMAEADRATGSFAASTMANFDKAGIAVATFVVTANLAIAKFVEQVAGAELNNEIFARQMWMNVDAAVAYRESLKALGTDLNSLYLSPELMEKFLKLRQQTTELAPPSDFGQTEKGVRDVTFEFQRLKLEASYSMYWIGYYIAKDLAGPMGDFRDWFSNFNDWITKTMPIWTKQVADFVAGIAKLGNALYLLVRAPIDIWNMMGESTQRFIGMMTGAGAALLVFSNPFTAMVASMLLFLGLIDDYYTYEKGGQSALPGLWKQIDAAKKSMQENGAFKAFKDDLDKLAISVGKLAVSLGDLIKQVAGPISPTNIFTSMIKQADDFVKMLAVMADVLGHIASGDFTGAKNSWDAYQASLLKAIVPASKNMFGDIVPTPTPGPYTGNGNRPVDKGILGQTTPITDINGNPVSAETAKKFEESNQLKQGVMDAIGEAWKKFVVGEGPVSVENPADKFTPSKALTGLLPPHTDEGQTPANPDTTDNLKFGTGKGWGGGWGFGEGQTPGPIANPFDMFNNPVAPVSPQTPSGVPDTTNNLTVSPTYNITGGDPKAIADEIDRRNNALIIRVQGGAVG